MGLQSQQRGEMTAYEILSQLIHSHLILQTVFTSACSNQDTIKGKARVLQRTFEMESRIKVALRSRRFPAKQGIFSIKSPKTTRAPGDDE